MDAHAYMAQTQVMDALAYMAQTQVMDAHAGVANYWLRKNILNLYLDFATSWP